MGADEITREADMFAFGMVVMEVRLCAWRWKWSDSA